LSRYKKGSRLSGAAAGETFFEKTMKTNPQGKAKTSIKPW
jgi:hypothetical protein